MQCPAPEPDRKSRTLLRRAYPMSGSACAIRRAAVRVRGGTTATARASTSDSAGGLRCAVSQDGGSVQEACGRVGEGGRLRHGGSGSAPRSHAAGPPFAPYTVALAVPAVAACGDSLAAASAPQHLFEVAHSGTVSRAMFYGSGAFSGSCAPRARCMA
jgi:hypothetical protein